jgi:hypothetical protein
MIVKRKKAGFSTRLSCKLDHLLAPTARNSRTTHKIRFDAGIESLAAAHFKT